MFFIILALDGFNLKIYYKTLTISYEDKL